MWGTQKFQRETLVVSSLPRFRSGGSCTRETHFRDIGREDASLIGRLRLALSPRRLLAAVKLRPLSSIVRALSAQQFLRRTLRSDQRMKSGRVGATRLRFAQPRVLIALISQITLYREEKKRR